MAIVIAAGMGIGTVWTNSDALVSMSAPSSRLGASIGAAQSSKEFGDMVGPLLVPREPAFRPEMPGARGVPSDDEH